MRKIPKAKVCLLSPHPLVLVEWERLLAPSGLEVQVQRIDVALMASLGKQPLPPAEVFVTDAYASRQTTESLVAAIQQSSPAGRQLIVAEKLSEAHMFPLLRLGAKALLSYAEAHERLPQAVAAVAAGGFWVPRELLARFIETNLLPPRGRFAPSGPGALSQRERQVLDAVLENLANKEIADKLHITERTVKFHVSRLLEKFGVRRRSDLILHCLQDRSTGL